MASLEGSAELVSATVFPTAKVWSSGGPPSLPAQDASSCIRSIHDLFAAPTARREEGPSPKRRKSRNGNAIPVPPHADFDRKGSVVLAKVSIDLNVPTPSQDSMDNMYISIVSQEPIQLQLESCRRDHAGQALQMKLWNAINETGVDLVATTSAPFVDSVISHLRSAAALAASLKGRNHNPVSRAAFCRCQLHPPAHGCTLYKLVVEIRWTLGISVVEDPEVRAHYMNADLKLLSTYMSDGAARGDKSWNPSDFYDSVHVPPADTDVSPRIKQSLIDTKLLPFQQRTVDWLLRREGVAFSSSGLLESSANTSSPASFRLTQDATGVPCYVSQLRGTVVTNLDAAKGDTLQLLRGGILAEEMGLGKTVELIALISHHKRDIPEGNIYDTYTGAQVRPSGATLIITPPSILEQWVSEIHAHAPDLKVCHYKGLPPQSAPKRDHATATVDFLIQHDVVVTTYQVLSKEIHHAMPPPDRSSRRPKRQERRHSPLVGISWWRVCLDEAQMIESGVSQAAHVARIIPRCNAWAVSGTPLRKDVQDLRGLLIFLRCDAFANNKAVWSRLDKASFKGIFNEISIRNTKVRVRDDLQIPPQKRVVITVPFTTIEEQHYNEMMRQMCDSCWLTPEGQPIEEGRNETHPEVIERMREWLIRLRQTCLHANVGRKNRKALGGKNGALRTVHEVLEVMIEQNDTKWKAEAREMILCLIKMGHIQAYAGNSAARAKSSLQHYDKARIEAQSYIATCRAELLAEQQRLGRTFTADEDENIDGDNMGRIPVLRKSLRSFLELEHAAQFFTATAWHQIKENPQLTEPESDDWREKDKSETDYYEAARVIRRELLKESKGRAQQQMAKVDFRKPFYQIPTISDPPDLGGIEARKILDTMDNLSDYLNEQAQLIQTWRTKIVDILLTRLVDDEDDKETTGEEYEDSLKAQDELYVYIMALRTLVADRNAAVNGLQDNLVEIELKAAERQALKGNEEGDRGHAPQLLLNVVNTRRGLQAKLQAGSLKGVVSGIRSLITALQWRADSGDARASSEVGVLQRQIVKVQTIVTEQAKAITELEREQEMYRGTMNQRLEYYRQFQHISDTVTTYKEKLDEMFDAREFHKTDELRERKLDLANGFRTKCTYLKHLRNENQNEATAECIICREDIEIGVLTACGHKYCKECINQWWQVHRSCPTCKQKLSGSDFKDITFKPTEIRAKEETTAPASPTQASTPGSSSTASIYSEISDSTMKEIKMIDLEGSYGTKVDMIARHLIWIRNNDPGAKSIIFSQFGDFLEVLHEALKKWKIGTSSVTEKDGIRKFKADASTECLLLDAKTDSSGLTLVNATYVFLCEPLINPAIELQAINRVHRIGQQRPTTVFMYLISDTVEEAIYDLSVARRLEHISINNNSASSKVPTTTTPALKEQTLDAANSAKLLNPPFKQLMRRKGEGEIVKEDDLWHCLFGKHKRTLKPVLETEVGREFRARAAEARRAGQGEAEGTTTEPSATTAGSHGDVDMVGSDFAETLPIVAGGSRGGGGGGGTRF
ncbi:E3 ubiquitin-protein ligase SHPRH [Alternaria panax]|uniref:E3 ubiquitin-protein ligase SHPRH n=1 Tax=Alternaria panax TaxID=48097 RepID=A0AAD4ILI6_9PLEO|nr:E3 ubiquitin-protein ligase SHPRH [Alternaria panax]